MLPSSSWVSLAAPAEPFGWWIHKASLLEGAFLRPPFRGGCSAPRGGEGRARSPGPLSAEPARCPSGGAGSGPDRDPAEPERPPCARGCGKSSQECPAAGAGGIPKYVK